MGDFMQKLQARRIDSKYSLIRKIGQGGHGAVYLGRDFDTGLEVALKLEHRDIAPSILEEERDSYSLLEDLPGFPKVYWYGWFDDYKILAFQLLGPSLDDVFAYCGNQFSLKTVLMIADQLFTRFEALHSRQLLHRDIKPQNCLLGTGKDGNTVYVTDFGLAQEYQNRSEDYKETTDGRPHLVGTARYACIRAHLGQAQSPRDDLESLVYMMVFFLKGRLPWQGLKAKSDVEKATLIAKKKHETSPADLCSGLPDEFTKLMEYAKSLQGGRMPNYSKLRELFRQLAHDNSIEYDNVYDWTILKYLEQAD